MDKYEPYMHTGLCLKDANPIPGKIVKKGDPLSKVFPVGYRTPSICRVKISFDQFMYCMNQQLFQNLPYILHFEIYDEDIVRTREECMLRYQFLKYLNQMRGSVFDFYLSDSSLPAYISFMNSIDWKWDGVTTFHLSMDRNPVSEKKIPLELARGKVDISEEQLLWYSDQQLSLLPGKVSHVVVNDAKKLKRFVAFYMNELDRHYHLSRLNDFDKAYIAYHYLFDKNNYQFISMPSLGICYAMERTYYDEKGIQRLNPSASRWESHPVGTLEHYSGVCSGQARLYSSLLNNPDIRIHAETVGGTIPSGEIHCWSDFVIDNRLYQCCTTLKGVFADLDHCGYKTYDKYILPKLYPHDSFNNQGLKMIRRHTEALKK